MNGYEIVKGEHHTGLYVFALDGYLGRFYCSSLSATTDPPPYELGPAEPIPDGAPILRHLDDNGWPEFDCLVPAGDEAPPYTGDPGW